MAKLYNIKVQVVENKQLSANHKLLTLLSPEIAKSCLPGQFITIDCQNFLRRPFGIASVKGNKIEVLYRILGPGTRYLSGKKTGDKINVFGPLGKAFPEHKGKYIVFVAGGTGIASLRYFARKIRRGMLFYGAKKKDDLVGMDVFIDNDWDVRIATEDGSAGYKGFISGLFERFEFSPKSVVYVCGPRPMLKEIARIAGKSDIKCYVILEEMMACGIGTCRGCVVKIRKDGSDFEYKSVCKDGPVFRAKDIVFE